MRLVSTIKSISVYPYIAGGVMYVLIVSFLLYFLDQKSTATELLKYTLVVGSLPVWHSLLRNIAKGSYGVDIIAGTALIGDGVNDAPALASPDVRIALGTHGETLASDSGVVVILNALRFGRVVKLN